MFFSGVNRPTWRTTSAASSSPSDARDVGGAARSSVKDSALGTTRTGTRAPNSRRQCTAPASELATTALAWAITRPRIAARHPMSFPHTVRSE
jgi:hypothetical protein